ncbi:hypothetical protein JCM19037_1407 [Geomicrobium sp. JCM 19037]|uniref:hypothetical protein n=1 Tax=Geomicrobium sp. JCM 19037 TaxID=1460634 RepID=UPI00045F2E2A|nr:hypothetical protein [Geomicrobium sp. JCM 19037]GAK03114.1 hypothetical protein JCM19037_1407 [Geomicrobium sp. JCM 19037]
MPYKPVLPMNLQYFADGGDGGDGGNQQTDQGDGGSSQQTNQQTQQPSQTSNNQSQDGKTFDESYVKSLRTEAAGYRTEKNALQEQVNQMKRALGLENDEVDPDQLANQLQDRDQEIKSLKVENAFSAIANKIGADPN